VSGQDTTALLAADSTAHQPSHDYVALLTAVPPRLLTYAAILLAVGAAAWRLWVVPRARTAADAAPMAFARARRTVALAGLIGAGAGVIAAGWQLSVQLGALGGDADSGAMLAALVRHTRWGAFWMAQSAALTVAAVAFWVAWRGERRADEEAPPPGAYAVAGGAAAVAALAEAGLGHAAADAGAPVLALVSAGAHVLGVSVWLGTLTVLAIAWLALAEPPPDPADALLVPVWPAAHGRWSAPSVGSGRADAPQGAGRSFADDVSTGEWMAQADPPRERAPAALVAPQVAAFSRLALVGAGLTVTAGLVNAWLRLAVPDTAAPVAARLGALAGTRYGWLLVAKLALVAGIAAFGAVNWRRNSPGLAREGGVATLERDVRLELGVAVLALVLSAALAVTSPPGE
jgi:putative copper resistance protein D